MSLLPPHPATPTPSPTRRGAGHPRHAVGRPLVASPGSAGSKDSVGIHRVGIHRAVPAPRRRFGASGGAPRLGEDLCSCTHAHPDTSSGGACPPSGLVRPGPVHDPEVFQGSFCEPRDGTQKDTPPFIHWPLTRPVSPSSKVRGQKEGALGEAGSERSREVKEGVPLPAQAPSAPCPLGCRPSLPRGRGRRSRSRQVALTFPGY